jgi:hypothetical protein
MRQFGMNGRCRRDFERGVYNWKVRPAGVGGSVIKSCWVDVSISGTATSTTQVITYGTPVKPTGDALPDATKGYGLVGYVTPLSCQGTATYDGVAPSGLTYGGGGNIGVVFYRDANKFSFGSQDWKATGSCNMYGTFNNYGYYGGRYNAAVVGNDTLRANGFTAYLLTQAWPAPWTPNKVGLRLTLGCNKNGGSATISFGVRVTFVWTVA